MHDRVGCWTEEIRLLLLPTEPSVRMRIPTAKHVVHGSCNSFPTCACRKRCDLQTSSSRRNTPGRKLRHATSPRQFLRHHPSPLFDCTRDTPPTSAPPSLAISPWSSLPSHRGNKASSRILVSLFLRTSVSLQSQTKSAKCATLAQTPSVQASKQAPSLPPSPIQSPTLPHLRRGKKEIPKLTTNPP